MRMFRRWLEIQLTNIPKEFYPFLIAEARRAAVEAKDARQQAEEQKSIVDDRKSNGVIKRIAAGLVIGSHSSAMWSMQSRGGIDLLK